MTIAEVASLYRSKGFQFVAIGEHSQDMTPSAVEDLKRLSMESSDGTFLIIPGIEFSCRGGLHIFGMGTTQLTDETDPVAVAQMILQNHGVAILAHPGRYRWQCPPEVLSVVQAAEIWNLVYDGKYTPSPHALNAFCKMQNVNPKLLAVAGHDFHRMPSFYDVGIEMDVMALSPDLILEGIRHGAYSIKSRFFSSEAHPKYSRLKALWFNVVGWQLTALRKVRDLL